MEFNSPESLYKTLEPNKDKVTEPGLLKLFIGIGESFGRISCRPCVVSLNRNFIKYYQELKNLNDIDKAILRDFIGQPIKISFEGNLILEIQ